MRDSIETLLSAYRLGGLREPPRSALNGCTPHINYPSLRAWPPARRPSSPNRVTCSSSRLGSAICDTTPPCSAWQQTQVTPLSPYLPFHSLIPDPLSFSLFQNFLQLTDVEEEEEEEEEGEISSWTRVVLLNARSNDKSKFVMLSRRGHERWKVELQKFYQEISKVERKILNKKIPRILKSSFTEAIF